ncbi:Wadjet anti-phage system protein JetD domain-containing protein [Streptomyces rubradiris]|uniref:Wadjet anti-phage system protein JetD domain-containing protein n=1 Tax=Streptomyces rubradiris TaxID=285531 RepID=UPI0036ECDF93
MPASTTPAWTTPQDVTARLRKRWENGIYLTELAAEADWKPVCVPLRGPRPSEITRHYNEVLAWAQSWAHAATRKPLRLEHRRVGGQLVGRNDIPHQVWVDHRKDLWKLLGVTDTVHRYQALLASAQATVPRLAAWMAAHPMKVVKLQDVWPRLEATVRWIADYHGPALYVRQIDVPGVDTKFIEHHRATLTALLEHCLPADRITAAAPRTNFAARFGFLQKPGYLRFRILGEQALAGFRELTVRADEFTSRPSGVTAVYVVENETTFLAFPAQPDSIVFHGGGYAVTQLSGLPWLHDVRLVYWGDLDTHGFTILNRLRRAFPHTESMLMNRSVLMAHKDQWVKEAAPTVEPLETLTHEESDVYRILTEGDFGQGVRLEQERVRFCLLQAALAELPDNSQSRQPGDEFLPAMNR